MALFRGTLSVRHLIAAAPIWILCHIYLQANALQEKPESDSLPSIEALKQDEDDKSEEYDPELEALEAEDQDQENDYKALSRELSIATSNTTTGRHKVSSWQATTFISRISGADHGHHTSGQGSICIESVSVQCHSHRMRNI